MDAVEMERARAKAAKDWENPSIGVPVTLRNWNDERIAGVLKVILPTADGLAYHCEIEGGFDRKTNGSLIPDDAPECSDGILEFWIPGDDAPLWMCARCAGLVINVEPTA